MRLPVCLVVLLSVPQAWALSSTGAPALPLSVGDDAVVRQAVREVVAETRPEPLKPGTFSAAGGPSKTDQAFEAAKVESCLKGNALKHNPPLIHIGPIPIGLGGILALPFLGYAAATGKCN